MFQKPNLSVDSESRQLFLKIFFSVWAVIGFYTIFYSAVGMYFAASAVGIGVFILSPVTYWLERSGHSSIARYLFLLSANFYIFTTGLAFDHQVHAEYYAVPAVMVVLLIGKKDDWKFILFGGSLPILSWVLSRFVGAAELPLAWQHVVRWEDFFTTINFFGSFGLSIVFLAIFTKTIQDQRMQMIATAKMSSLGEMAGGIAHEINNPLAIIAGKAGLMKLRLTRGPVNLETLQSDLTKIEDTANRIGKITHGLRTFSRNSEQDPLTTESLKKIFSDTLELCGERFPQKNVNLTSNIPDDLLLRCRSVQLSQVFINLLGNGLDAVQSAKEKWMRVEVERIGGSVRIRFIDAGTGIPRDVVEKMMIPFFTTKELGHGTGLGLSISKAIIEEHGGRLYYDPKYKNTCFVVELPEAFETDGQSIKPTEKETFGA